MECFSVAYQSKVLYVSLDWLKNILFCESVQQLTFDLKYYGLMCNPQTKTIQFQRDSFQSSKPIVIFYFNNLVSLSLIHSPRS